MAGRVEGGRILRANEKGVERGPDSASVKVLADEDDPLRVVAPARHPDGAATDASAPAVVQRCIEECRVPGTQKAGQHRHGQALRTTYIHPHSYNISVVQLLGAALIPLTSLSTLYLNISA